MNAAATPKLLENRTLLITGASEGIGREAALTFARQGARVILHGRNQQKLERVRAEIDQLGRQPAEIVLLDFATACAADCEAFADQVAALTPQLDAVLHNASILGSICPMAEIPAEEWLQVMQVNVNTTFFLARALLPLLLKAPQATLLLTTSSVGRQGRAGWGSYAVSKFATEGMMQVLAEEYRDQGLKVYAINPGGTRTGMRAAAFPEENPQLLKTPADLMPVYLALISGNSDLPSGSSVDAQPGRKAGPAS